MGGDSSDESGVTTLATQGGITFFGSIFGRALSFVFLVVVTKLVSPSTFGVYSLGLAIVLFIKSIADLSVHRGIDYFFPQYISQSNYEKARYLFGITNVIALLGTGMAVILIWSFTPMIASIFGENRLTSIVPILALSLPFLAFRDIVTRVFISIKQLKYRVFLNNIFLPGAKLFLTLGLLLAGYELLALLGGYLLSIILISFIGVGFLIYRVGWLFKSSTERVELRGLFSYSLPLVFAGVIYATISQIDFFIIGYYPNTSSEDLAIYKVANLLGINLLIFLNSLSPVFKPLVTEAKHDDELLNSRFALAARWILLFTIPAALTLAIAPRTYLSLLFTSEYAAGGSALVVLVLGYLINSSVGPEGMVLEGIGYTRLTLFNTIVMVGVNTILDLLLVPRIGILGAAIGTAAGLSCAVSAGVLELRYYRGILPFDRRTLNVAIAGIPPLVVGWTAARLIDHQLFLAIFLPIVVLFVYLLSLMVFNAFGEEDRIVTDLLEKKMGVNIFSKLLS